MENMKEIREALDTEWAPHFLSAVREGWFLSDLEGSMYGPLQVQKVDDPEEVGRVYGVTVPSLDSDGEAHAVVREGAGVHHEAARKLLQRFNPKEYEAVMSGKFRV